MKKSTITLLSLALVSSVLSSVPYTNPVINVNSPDPGVLQWNSRFYLVSTTGDAPDAFPIFVSDNLVDWKQVGHCFPDWKSIAALSWAKGSGAILCTLSELISSSFQRKGDFWAPELHLNARNETVLYFTARSQEGILSISTARSSSPAGPFTPAPSPLVASSPLGQIDATVHYDSATDTRALIWKIDGNSAGQRTPILARRLDDTGQAFADNVTHTLMTNDPLSWEHALVEGPWVVKHNNTFFLFYSANGFASPRYAIGVARSPSLLGDYSKNTAANPILHTNFSSVDPHSLQGPGHCSVIRAPPYDDHSWVIIYHAWHYDHIGGGNPRVDAVDPVVWGSDNWPYIAHGGVPSFKPSSLPILQL